MGTDLIGQARTGTGKTLAFGIPLIQRTVAQHDPDYAEMVPGKPQALIVAPTRELALQVSGDLALASADRGVRVLTVYGGVGYDTQLDTLQAGVDIVVGTPGRLIDLMNRRALDLSHVKSLVLDEADEMLDLGFLPDVEKLLSKTPETRQTMLFSATMPAAIVALARTHMRHPMNIRAESSYENATVPATAQFIYQVHDLDKPEIIGRVLQAEDAGKVLVFTKTKRAAQRVADDLEERGFSAGALHGDMAQVAREKTLTRFRSDKLDVLVATDVAARGIDVAGRHPRHQLQLPRGRQGLHPPHRPHRSRGCLGHRDHLRGLGRRDPVEDDQQDARPAVRGPAGDVLHVGAPLPRAGHPARHPRPDRRGQAGREEVRPPPRSGAHASAAATTAVVRARAAGRRSRGRRRRLDVGLDVSLQDRLGREADRLRTVAQPEPQPPSSPRRRPVLS